MQRPNCIACCPLGKRLLLKSLPGLGYHRRLYLEGWESNTRGTWSKSCEHQQFTTSKQFHFSRCCVHQSCKQHPSTIRSQSSSPNLSCSFTAGVINYQQAHASRSVSPLCEPPLQYWICPCRTFFFAGNKKINLTSCSCRDLQKKDLVVWILQITPTLSYNILEKKMFLSISFYPGHWEADGAGCCFCCPV